MFPPEYIFSSFFFLLIFSLLIIGVVVFSHLVLSNISLYTICCPFFFFFLFVIFQNEKIIRKMINNMYRSAGSTKSGAFSSSTVALPVGGAGKKLRKKALQMKLFHAASVGDVQAMKSLSKVISVGVRQQITGQVALHCAAGGGHCDAVRYLVQSKKFKMDVEDAYGCTPLHYACYHGHMMAAGVLMEGSEGAYPSPFRCTAQVHYNMN